MTRQQGLYLRDLRDGFGFTRDQAVELWRAYGLKTDPQGWSEPEFDRAVEVLNVCGPSFVKLNHVIREARKEYEARVARRKARAA